MSKNLNVKLIASLLVIAAPPGIHANAAEMSASAANTGKSIKLSESAADYAFTKVIHGNVGVDYTSWEYGASAIQPSGYFEPDSETNVTMIKVGVGYAF